jgi:8-oxo-dGTP pyrophosphatase MutT (NUDIX family)
VRAGKVEVLLVTSSSGKRWIIPKGWISLWMTAADSAAKEAWEEAGIEGTVLTPAIGFYNTRKWGYPCRVDVFLMSVENEMEEYPEAAKRKRQWMSIPKAIKRIREAELKQLFRQFLSEKSKVVETSSRQT